MSESFLATRLAEVAPSATIAVTQKARALKAAGHDVIGLGAGEPDFDTPEHICQAAIAAMNRGETRYTAVDGTAELKDAICMKFRRDNRLNFTPEQISVGAGAKQVLFNALLASLNPGDEVMIPAPYWVSYRDIVALAGGTARIVPTTPEEDFCPRVETLEAAITPRSKWLILNSPNNPSGATLTAERLKDICALLERHPQIHLLTDDIYEHLVYEGDFVTALNLAPQLAPRCLIVNGVSKAYAMTGWRIGYGAGPQALISAMRTIQSQSTTNPCAISQAAACAALTGPQDALEPNRAIFRRRRDLVVAALRSVPGLALPVVPRGAFYVYPHCGGMIGKRSPDGHILTDEAACVAYLLEKAGVACVPGAAFGLSPYFRLSIAASDKVLSAATTRIATACQQLAAITARSPRR